MIQEDVLCIVVSNNGATGVLFLTTLIRKQGSSEHFQEINPSLYGGLAMLVPNFPSSSGKMASQWASPRSLHFHFLVLDKRWKCKTKRFGDSGRWSPSYVFEEGNRNGVEGFAFHWNCYLKNSMHAQCCLCWSLAFCHVLGWLSYSRKGGSCSHSEGQTSAFLVDLHE